MKAPSRHFAAAALLFAASVLPPAGQAQLADLADFPLANTPNTSVLPNLMYVLDDSGSMQWNYMPDQIQRSSRGDYFLNCKRCNHSTLTVSSVSTSAERITSSAEHGGAVGTTVVFTAGTPPAPLTTGTTYFIQSVPDTTRFTLSTTSGGAVINITGTTTGSTFLVGGGCTGPGGRQGSGYGYSITNPSNPPGATCGNDNADPNDLETSSSAIPAYGEAPFYAAKFNQIWYNPDITYSPAVTSTGASLTAYPASAARRDAFLSATVDNLVANFQEVIYCSVINPTAAQRVDPLVCRFNGRHNVSPFLPAQPAYFKYFLNTVGANGGLPNAIFRFKIRITNSNPHYYNITPHEYCSDPQLSTCALATVAGASPAPAFSFAAPVRWCKTAADAALDAVVSGTSGTPATARCRKKFDRGTYPYPRLGRMARVDIIPANASYVKSASSSRSDCGAGPTCSYAEELQNFANWYSYYRNRLALMKTATGRAFLSIDDRFRVGFITINPNDPVTASKFLGVDTFAAAHRNSFYTTLYNQATNGSTPLREALSRVGRYYAGSNSGINSGMIPNAAADPMKYSCQTNYALLTTDGYWNGAAGLNLAGGAIGNQDNANSGYTTRSVGAYDGNIAGASDTLADVAAYYYKTDLRTAGTLATNNVPTSAKDTNATQHMVTFTLGLGLEGFMDYLSDYETNAGGDFSKIKAGTSGACSWVAGVCNWPAVAENEPSTLDDLWHAAVNGRGTYFSASDPNSLAQGLTSALAKLQVMTAAAAASATSSPNITETDNYIYSSTFRTGEWDGEIVAQRIDTTTGNVIPAIVWAAQALLDARTADSTDSRQIWTIDEAAAGKRKAFNFATLSAAAAGSIAAEQSYFTGKCGSLSQCTLLTIAQQAIANTGLELVNYLRGQRGNEGFVAPETAATFRTRAHVLGDPVNATPAFVRAPNFGFADAVTPDYSTYKTTQETRQSMLYIAANDGMLHALNGDTGQEVWAYVPRIVMPNLHRLATANWGSTHRFNVDGSPQVMDVFISGAWKTVMVAGLNSGGRGYYALDVTDPANPSVLWEFCNSSSLCQNWDTDMGFTYGNAVIAKRPSDNKWVAFVTSGMNNVSPGTGRGYLYTIDIATGALLDKTSTGEGTVAFPSGLNKMSGYADNFFNDNTAKFIYAGDLLGNLWKFDTATAAPVVSKLALLADSAGKPQSITTRPELANIDTYPVIYVGTGRYLGEDDLQDPATLIPPLPFAFGQSLYAIKDRGVSYGNIRTANMVQQTIIDAGTTRTTSQNAVDWASRDGWYVDFNPGNVSPGERVNLDPQLVQGTLVVVTNVPNNSACAVGGDSWIYQFDYKTGKNVASSAGGVAGQKLTGKITVGVVVVRLPSGIFRGIATGATGEKTSFAVNTGGGGGSARRISWRELLQK